jgi:putative membrane protein
VMNCKLMTAFVTAALCGAVVCANAQNVSISRDGRPEKMAAIRLVKGLNSADTQMLQEIYWGNAFEIRSSEIAQSRGHSAWCQEFAKEMIHEHTMAQNEIKLLAMDKGVALSNDMPRSMVNKLNYLKNVSSGSFDEAYRQVQLASHGDASLTLQHAIKRGHDEEVRGLAVKLLPPTKTHYALAKVEKTMMGATKASHGS